MRRGKDSGSGPLPEPKRLKSRSPVRERWGKEHGFTLAEVERIVVLGRKCGRENTHAVNGDTHPHVRPVTDDKNVHAKAWENQLDATANELRAIVDPKGFRVVFNGLFPSLERAGEREGSSIFIPYE
jgi:hypothetical protein